MVAAGLLENRDGPRFYADARLGVGRAGRILERRVYGKARLVARAESRNFSGSASLVRMREK